MNEKAFLKKYDIKDYDVPLSTVDIAIFAVQGGALKVLLVQRSEHPFKDKWALPGGFIDLKNDAETKDTAFRKLTEKTGIRSPYLEQVETVGNKSRDPRGWALTVLYFALIDFESIDAEMTQESRWVSIEEALSLGLAFDHKLLLSMAINRLRSKTRYSALPLRLMPEAFTLTELQAIFELVLGVSLQKKSFRRRLLAAELVIETGDMRPTNRRPAALYRITRALTDDFVFPGLLDVQVEAVT